MSNPYAASGSDFSHFEQAGETYDPRFFAWRGRIGRVRYLAYSMGATLLTSLVAGFLMGFVVAMMHSTSPILAVIVYVPVMVATVVVTVRRLNDMGQNGWLSILSLVPLVNFFFGLWLLFGKGEDGSNAYGPAPSANSTGVIIAAWLFPVALVGVISAVAIPAYSEYTKKAKARAMQPQAALSMQAAIRTA